jgi:hypothetical protein
MPSNDVAARKASMNFLMRFAQMMCAPFWWSVGEPGKPATAILNNGTICYVDTGTRELGITANHVYQTYLRALQKHGADAIEWQYGSSTIYPERHVVDTSERWWDIATFDVPGVFVSATLKQPKDHHHAVHWPPAQGQTGEPVLYGGYPESLRADKGAEAELPFQWVIGRVSETDAEHIIVKPEFRTSEWQGPDRNYNPSGWSGGPVFRDVENQLIHRLELVGFIYAYSGEDHVIARHADVVLADGNIRH